jgi:hypothetical protein
VNFIGGTSGLASSAEAMEAVRQTIAVINSMQSLRIG